MEIMLNERERKILVDIKEALEDPESSGSLWVVLTALRGPDDEGDFTHDIKASTTAVIRHALFGGRAAWAQSFVAEPDYEEKAELRRKLLKGPLRVSHFLVHALRAFSVLGLKWDEVNDLSIWGLPRQ